MIIHALHARVHTILPKLRLTTLPTAAKAMAFPQQYHAALYRTTAYTSHKGSLSQPIDSTPRSEHRKQDHNTQHCSARRRCEQSNNSTTPNVPRVESASHMHSPKSPSKLRAIPKETAAFRAPHSVENSRKIVSISKDSPSCVLRNCFRNTNKRDTSSLLVSAPDYTGKERQG